MSDQPNFEKETEKHQLWAVYYPDEDKYLHFERKENDGNTYTLDFEFFDEITEDGLVFASANTTPLIVGEDMPLQSDDDDESNSLESEFVVVRPTIESKLTLKIWQLVKEFDKFSDKVVIVGAEFDEDGHVTLDFSKSHKLITE